MSIIDKVVAAVTPPESEKSRIEAREKAESAASPGDWLSLVLDHHLEIEEAFAAVAEAKSASQRRSAEKWLGIILTGHATAEESVIYPALALHGEKSHATAGYTEQAAVKTQMAALNELEPMSQDYVDKLEHIRGAVAHHVYEEEGTWFPELKQKVPAVDQAKLTQRYHEEFSRYVGQDRAA